MDQLLCTRCKKKECLENKTQCADCLEVGRRYQKEKRDVLKKEGLCLECKINPRRDDGVYCQMCLDKHRIKREARKLQGLCIVCNKEAEAGIYCKSCNENVKKQDRKSRQNRKQLGLCTKCGTPVDSHEKCQSCRAKKAEQFAKLASTRRENGLCINCCRAALDDHRFCDICYFKHTSVKRLGKVVYWADLKSLFESQKEICPYTGLKMKLGKNATLDHIIPSSNNGSNDISNLQWVCSSINIMKWNLSEDDFLNLVKLIYKNRFE